MKFCRIFRSWLHCFSSLLLLLILIASHFTVTSRPFEYFNQYEQIISDMLQTTSALLEDNDLQKNRIGEDFLNNQDPEVTPGLFEGDIAGFTPEMYTRVSINFDLFPEKKWVNATVPYVISWKYLPQERKVIETAIATLNFFTCIKFIPWDRIQRDYILIWPMEKPSGCWSSVGRVGGQQLIGLEAPTQKSVKCLGSVGKPIHELLHALGTFHEQSRFDRDEYVSIELENIYPSTLRNFKKQSEENTTILFPYDYDSVMHYGSHFFSIDRSMPSIIPHVPQAQIGQRKMLSRLDCLKINRLYGCLNKEPFERNKYEVFCDTLGL